MAMMGLASFYLSMRGRIGRRAWWLGNIGLLVVGWVVQAGVLTLMGIDPRLALDPAAPQGVDTAIAWVGGSVWVLLLWPQLALGVKRRHDRGSRGFDVVAWVVLTGLVQLALGLGIHLPTTTGAASEPGVAAFYFLVVFGLASISMLVILGVLKGTARGSRFGPPPGSRTATPVDLDVPQPSALP